MATSVPSEASAEIRTRRLVVVDDVGNERITLEVDEFDVAQVSVVPMPPPPGSTTAVVLFAIPASDRSGTGVGVELWCDGNSVGGINAWFEDGDWHAAVHPVA